MEDKLKELRDLRNRAIWGGGKEKIDKVHMQGKLTARERIVHLLDRGSFCEWNMLIGHADGVPGEGIIVGHGTVNGRVICVYSQDVTVKGGTMWAMHGRKMYKTVEKALAMKVPLIGLHDSPGGRVTNPDEGGIESLPEKSHGAVFFPNTEASGVIPQIAAILGACAGIAVYSPALNDFIFMVDGLSYMFITGPRVVKSVMGEDINAEQLGGSKVHASVSGVADFRVKSELDCFEKIKKLLSFLPSNNGEFPPVIDTGDDPDRFDDNLSSLVPVEPSKSYDMNKVIYSIVDNQDFLEVKADFAKEMITGFGRLAGQTIGIVANQPMVRAGSLTVDSSDKQARFMRFCDSFNIPLLMLVDTPAYMPGSQQEHRGIIRHGAKVLYALCESVVPRISVVLRKAYGGGNIGMGVTPGLGTDFVYKWPIAEAGVLGSEQSVDLLYSNEIAAAPDPVKRRARLVTEYRKKYSSVLFEASRNPFMEDVIEPRETRRVLIRTLQLLKNKSVTRYPKRHGNMPL